MRSGGLLQEVACSWRGEDGGVGVCDGVPIVDAGQNSGRLGWARGSMPNIGRGGEWRIPAGTCLQLKG